MEKFMIKLVTGLLILVGILSTVFAQDTLKLVTYNTHMLPQVCLRQNQPKRAKQMAVQLKIQGVDVIILQEVFDKRCQKILIHELIKEFPYHIWPSSNGFFKTNSGLMIFSKTQFVTLNRIFFKHSKGNDMFASKGAVLIELYLKNGRTIQIVDTHLQSEVNCGETQDIRHSQYQEIKEMLDTFYHPQIPQLIVGDMNTIQADNVSYNQMLKTLDVTSCDLVGENCFSFDRNCNSMITSKEKPQLIDYVLIKNGGKKHVFGTAEIKKLDSKFELSDHFPVFSTLTF